MNTPTIEARSHKTTPLPVNAVASDSGHNLALIAARSANGAIFFPPPEICPDTLERPVQMVRLSSRGKLYAFSRVHIGTREFPAPYVVGYVDLPEGIRLFTHLRNEDYAQLRSDMDVGVEIYQVDGTNDQFDFVCVPASEVTR